MTNADNTTRSEWVARQREHGNSPRAVLMKGLHPLINSTIDSWHRAVLRNTFAGFQEVLPGAPSLDMGCGYGRLADEAIACGLSPIVGIDFAHRFCVDFPREDGFAACGELMYLPFRDATLKSAYAVTALMYLSLEDAKASLQDLDRCLLNGAVVLLLEPSYEFNALVRLVLRSKSKDTLSRPGLTRVQMTTELAPRDWKPIAAGGCTWMTMLLPLLVATARFPGLYRWIERAVLALDRPRAKHSYRPTRFAMYRWIAFRKQ